MFLRFLDIIILILYRIENKYINQMNMENKLKQTLFGTNQVAMGQTTNGL